MPSATPSTDDRLRACFAAVFPDLSDREVVDATPATVAAWDSVANVTLLTVVEEEFGVEIPVDVLPSLTSFQAIRAFLDETSSE